MSEYNFTGAAEFLDECVPPNEMYAEIQEAMSAIFGLKKRIGKKAFQQVWHTLLTCADFVETISKN